jgi:hypothetical protein
MTFLSKSILLFTLNALDAVLTLIWLRLNVATEGNGLMARVLELGEIHFLSVKLLIGAITAYTLYRFSQLKLAQRGLKLALGVYVALMFVHLATGLSAMGWHGPGMAISYLQSLPGILLTYFS